MYQRDLDEYQSKLDEIIQYPEELGIRQLMKQWETNPSFSPYCTINGNYDTVKLHIFEKITIIFKQITLDDDQYEQLCLYLAANDPQNQQGDMNKLYNKYMENSCNYVNFSKYLTSDSNVFNSCQSLNCPPPRTNK